MNKRPKINDSNENNEQTMPNLVIDRRDRRRAFIADTVALIVFFTSTGVLNERFIAGMHWRDVLHARILGAFLTVTVGRPYGVWRDSLCVARAQGVFHAFYGIAWRS